MTSSDNSVDLYANLKPEEFIRGETPSDIAEQCLGLCQAFIGGQWRAVNGPKDIIVTRITGGLSNQLYRVQLKTKVASAAAAGLENPYDVTVKLYQSKIPKCFHPDDDERHNDAIILALMSEIGLSPKVYGIFSGGVIQAYHKHRIVGATETQDISIQKQIAHSLAVLHHLSVPIRKQTNWQLRQTEQMLLDAHQLNNVASLIEELRLETFQSFPILEELTWLKQQMAALQFPAVFCHNDFLGANMLLTEPNDKLLLIDLEYSTYGCRGFDIGVFMYQYGHEPNEYALFAMPEDSVLRHFIALYIAECEQVAPGFSDKAENGAEKILKETKLAMMVHFLFWTAFFMFQKENVIKTIPVDVKANFKFAEVYYQKYQLYKATRLDG